MIKMIIGFLFSLYMLGLTISQKKYLKPFEFYLKTIIIIFACILFLGQIIGG